MYLNFHFEPDIPKVPCDRDGLTQVLFNLLSNSTKFTQEGGITIATRFDAEKNVAVISVKDTGGGIPQEKINQLFEKFRQLGPKKKNEPSGTGLGLAICKEIIAQHGGEIWAESTVDEGSIFHFSLPIERRETKEDDGE